MLLAVILTAGSASFVSAQSTNTLGESLVPLVQDATDVVNTVIILLTAVCVVVFIVGLIRFVFNQGADAKKVGRDYMIYSIIAFAVLTALFALSNFLVGLFIDPTQNNDINIPTIGEAPANP